MNYSISKFFRFFIENLNIENNIREYDYNIKSLINHNKCKHYIKNKSILDNTSIKYDSNESNIKNFEYLKMSQKLIVIIR